MGDGRVGPVLRAGPVGQAVADAIRAENPRVVVQDRGGYLRVSSPGRCRVSRRGIEQVLGRAFALPRDLESVMPSFKGRIRFDGDGVEWTAAGQRAAGSGETG